MEKCKIDFMEVYADQTNKDIVDEQCVCMVEKSTGKKYAILIGISDYKYISDLNYCDEDVTSWYDFFNKKEYKIYVHGDKHKENYPKYSGLATEKYVRYRIKKVLSKVSKDDTVAIVVSGHGDGDGNGNSYLCMFDCDGNPNGNYTDKEFYNDIKDAKCKLFVFFDNCFSGGMLDELKSIDKIFATSTCTEKGYGYDDPDSKNGAWTQCFLEDTLAKYDYKDDIDLIKVFNDAKEKYPYDKADLPMMVCKYKKYFI